jgi:phage shock protein PspC (stress-responsive transcriptional regulator)
MEQTETTSATGSAERTQRSQELTRPVEGRMLAGVAKGVANNFGIADWIPRVFFAVTAFIGGLGLVLYAAGWAFIRSDDEPESPAERFFSGASGSRSWIGVAFIVIAGIIVLSNFTFLSGEVIWAAAFLVVGLLLYLGYIPGGQESENGKSAESKEGVQRMTTTTDDTNTRELIDTPAGDSPAGGSVTPPPVPSPTPTPPSPPKPREHSILGRLTIGFVLLGLGILAILDNIDSIPIDAEPRHYLALAVTIIGIGLIVGGFAGRARWLIIVSAILVPTLLFSPVFEYDWEERNFDLEVRPSTFAEVDDEYAIDLGEMVIDLRRLPWNGQELDLEAAIDAGNLEIYLPDGVGLIGEASVDVGRVSTFDSSGLSQNRERVSAGLGQPSLTFDEPGELGTVILDAHVDLGNIEIQRMETP